MDWITLLGVAHVCPRLAGVQDLKAARRHPRMGMSLRAIEMLGGRDLTSQRGREIDLIGDFMVTL